MKEEEDYEFTFRLDALQDYKLSSRYSTQLNEFDLKIESNYNFMGWLRFSILYFGGIFVILYFTKMCKIFLMVLKFT